MSIYGLQRSRFTRPADTRRTASDAQSAEPSGRRAESREKPTDQVLVRRLRAGDRGAFETIFRRYEGPLLSYCRHMLGSRDEAEDALQQTFIRAHRALVSGSPPRELRPWLYAIARNCAHTAISARRPTAELEGHEPSYDGLAADVQERADLRELVADLQTLPEDQRSALLLAELGDLSHEQIAGVVDCPPSKVKALIHQARTTLIAQRDARAASCEEIRTQLSVARGGELRRGPLRRHLGVCPGCRDFAAAVGAQRSSLAVVLPVLPTAGLALRILGHSAAGAASASAGGLGLAGGGHAAAAAAVTGGGSASAGASGAGAVTGVSAAGASAGGATAAGGLTAASTATGATGLTAAAGTATGAAGGLTAAAGTATGAAGGLTAAAGTATGAAGGLTAAAGTAAAATSLTATAGTATAAGGLAASGAGVSAAGALAAGGAGASGAGGVAAAVGGGLAAKLAIGGAVAVIASAGAAATLHRRDHSARRVSTTATGGHRSPASAAKVLAGGLRLKQARSGSVVGKTPKPTVGAAAKPAAAIGIKKHGPKAAGPGANGTKAGRTKAPTTAAKRLESASAKTSHQKAGSHKPRHTTAASSRGKTTKTASGTTGPTGSTTTATRRAGTTRSGANRPPATKRKIRGSGRLHTAAGLAGTTGAAKTDLKPTGRANARSRAKRHPPAGVTAGA